MIGFAFSHWKAIAIAGLIAWGWLHHENAKREAFGAGQAAERLAAKVEAGKRIIEMEKADETFRNLTALDRCRAFMRDSGLPERHCLER